MPNLNCRTFTRAIAVLCTLCVLQLSLLARSNEVHRPRIYKAGRNPDPQAARNVAMILGVGRHVVIRDHDRKTLRGHIEAISEDKLTIRRDGTNQSLEFDFQSVNYLEQNMTRSAKWFIIGAAVAVTVVILVTWYQGAFG